MTRPQGRRRADIFRRRFGEQHPIVPLLLAMPPGKSAALSDLWRFLERIGRDPLHVTRELLEEWLGSGPPGYRQMRVPALRALFRGALAAGAVATDPTEGMHYRRATVYAEHRFTDDEVRKLIAVAHAGVVSDDTRLASRRDVVMFLLLAWRPFRIDDLRALTWGDVRVSGDGGSLRLAGRLIVLPSYVVDALRAFRGDLSSAGAEPIDEDALLPALGKRVEVDWWGPDRSVLVPMQRAGFYLAISKRVRRAGLVELAVTGKTVKTIWLYRDDRPFAAWGTAPASVPRRRVPTSVAA